MEIEKLLQIKTDQSDKIGMILSNNIDLMHKDKACVTIDNWEKLTIEILLWHENEVKNLAIQRVSINEACKCGIPDPFTLMPYKCFRCRGKIELSEVAVCELTEWDGKTEANLCDCGKGEGNCKKQTEC